MTAQRMWLCIAGAGAGIAAALALGASGQILLIVVAVLACPVAMYLGMRGMKMNRGDTHADSAAPHKSPKQGPTH
jgi:hypothetical protein